MNDNVIVPSLVVMVPTMKPTAAVGGAARRVRLKAMAGFGFRDRARRVPCSRGAMFGESSVWALILRNNETWGPAA